MFLLKYKQIRKLLTYSKSMEVIKNNMIRMWCDVWTQTEIFDFWSQM